MFGEFCDEDYLNIPQRKSCTRDHVISIKPYKWNYLFFCNICGNGEIWFLLEIL